MPSEVLGKSLIVAVSILDIDVTLSVVDKHDITLFSTYEILQRTRLSVILKRSTTENLGLELTIEGNIILKDGLVGRETLEVCFLLDVFKVPPEHTTISRYRETLRTGFTDSGPLHIIDGVVMRFLQPGSPDGANHT